MLWVKILGVRSSMSSNVTSGLRKEPEKWEISNSVALPFANKEILVTVTRFNLHLKVRGNFRSLIQHILNTIFISGFVTE